MYQTLDDEKIGMTKGVIDEVWVSSLGFGDKLFPQSPEGFLSPANNVILISIIHPCILQLPGRKEENVRYFQTTFLRSTHEFSNLAQTFALQE